MTIRRPSARTLALWLPVIVWAALIFLSSAQTNAILSPDPTADFELRKTAHVLVFSILAVLVVNALRGLSARRAAILAFGFCAFYAASDELHQAFVATRGPRVTDVLIDMVGALVEIVVWQRLLAPRLVRPRRD